MGVGDSDSGAPIEMRVRSKQYNLNYPFHKKRITRMYMSFRQPEQETSEVTLRLHVDDSLEYEVHEAALFENFKWGEPWGGIWGFRSIVTTRTKVSASGHRIQMEIYNDQLDIPTTVYGIAFEFRPIRAKGVVVMAKPKRTFTGQEGQRSVGTAGPDAIRYDLDNLFAALDPDDTFKDGTSGGIGEENLRQVTIDQADEPTGNTGHIRQLFSWLANIVRKITGNANWYDAPKTTLTATKAHMDANTGVHGVGASTVESVAGAQSKVDVHEAKAAPHSGHETPSGAQAKVDTHEAKTAPHSGHETPAGAQAKVNSHASETSAHSATAAATANRIVVRDPYGRAQVATPTLANEIANKSYVDTKIKKLTLPVMFQGMSSLLMLIQQHILLQQTES